jgi:hypothetical protein
LLKVDEQLPVVAQCVITATADAQCSHAPARLALMVKVGELLTHGLVVRQCVALPNVDSADAGPRMHAIITYLQVPAAVRPPEHSHRGRSGRLLFQTNLAAAAAQLGGDGVRILCKKGKEGS